VLTDKFIIVFNGTVVEILNLNLILRAIKYLETKITAHEYDKIVFEIYGNGPALKGIFELADELEIRHKIYHEDFIKQEEMFQRILRANVCVIPPEENIYSDLFYTTKLVEMVYLKIPVIATRLKTYKYYYSEDSIFYFESGNVEQLAEALLNVFYNREFVEHKVQNAFRDYQKVSWNIMSERYITLIKQMLMCNNKY
jgi:glycosyltransferase involved in cell wall biosynthesis